MLELPIEQELPEGYEWLAWCYDDRFLKRPNGDVAKVRFIDEPSVSEEDLAILVEVAEDEGEWGEL